MALLTAAQARAQGVGLGLAPADLQALIDREEAELVRRFGPHAGPLSEVVQPRRNSDSLLLKRRIASVVSISEGLYVGDPSPTPRAASDYVIWADEGRIERSAVSLHWGAICTVVYEPADETDLRTMVLLELVRIASEQDVGVGGTVSGLGYSIGGGGATAKAWADARARQYARLGWRS